MARTSIYISILCFASLIIGMRSLVSGFDTETYVNILNSASLSIAQGVSISDFYLNYAYVHPEPLYSAFVYMLAFFNFSPREYLLTVAFVTFFCFGKAISLIDRRNNVEILFLVLCTMTFVFLFANAMRQGLALGISFLAVSYLLECKYKRFYLLIFIASLFHTSAFTLILLLHFLKLEIRVQILIFVITAAMSTISGLGFLFDFINIPVVTEKFLIYSQDGSANGWSYFSALLLPIVAIMFFTISSNRYFKMLLSIYLYLSIVCLLFSFSLTMFDRVSAYRFLFEPVIIMALCMTVKQKVIIKFFCLFFAICYFLSVVFPSGAVHKTLFY